MPTSASILDFDVEREIQDILKLCGTNMASISVRYMQRETNAVQMEHGLRTLRRMEEAGQLEYTITSNGDQVFHIASITKILVAVAVFIAVEARAKDRVPNNPYAKFRNIQNEPLTKLYNRHSTTKIGGLPGDPTMYNLIVHHKGLASSNHRLLAPDGTPIMTLAELREDLIRPIARDAAYIDVKEPWTRYSNTNYAIIAMTIEALWGRGLDSFMYETLFAHLGMKSTSIGFSTDRGAGSHPWVVDSEDNLHQIPELRYKADGAEAGALGAYSTTQDIDIFFKFLLDTFHGTEIIPGFDLDVLGKILQMTNKQSGMVRFTPLGLYTTLDSSVIGSQSSNMLQFPDDVFSTYPVLPGSSGEEMPTFHMVGSAIGCNCATAFYPSQNKSNHAIVVLTDTSGPVDSSDHILRLLLRRMAGLQYSHHISHSLWRPKSVRDMVEQAKSGAMQKWKEDTQKDMELLEKAPKIHKNITGVFKGDGFSQRLHISTTTDGKACINVSGSSTPYKSKTFGLIWIDQNSVKVCIPPHLSIDCLGNGDWSDLTFAVKSEGFLVTKLTRKTESGEDHYLRFS
ncbi:beta-lactamase/transpeptidase-like protein [Lophiotrema nucula]|uniref:Beta-lactamase/transpeptidase-like protein n=1 Tax=Lophiotrema nucula TaxID=690887 RepID=A0A6A5ZGX7_9PLEO|nr:beta-lactamase/transpeptidase-like protein [Lophiotrema nucula]